MGKNKKYDAGICERVKLIRSANNMTRKDFADMLQVNEFYVKSVELARHTPHFDFLVLMKHKFNLTWEWIIEGTGPMNPPTIRR